MLLAVNTEAEQESAINRELAHVMCARLDAARRATERLLGVLQVCPAQHSPVVTCNAVQVGRRLSRYAGSAGNLRVYNAAVLDLQACANAEAAYTRTLTAASRVKLVGDCDGASVRGALDGFSDLPFMVGQVSDEAFLPQRRWTFSLMCGALHHWPDQQAACLLRWRSMPFRA